MARFLPWLVPLALGALILWLNARFPHALENDDAQPRLVYLLALLCALAPGVILATRSELFQRARYALAWIAIFVVLVLGYAQKDALYGALMPQAAAPGAGGSMVFRRAEDGHFYVEGYANGALVRFMVDTGASGVVLTPEDARRAGFAPESLSFTQLTHTANGVGRGAPALLRSLKIGDFVLEDVPASVNQAAMDASLLGMEYLQHFDIKVENDTLIFTP